MKKLLVRLFIISGLFFLPKIASAATLYLSPATGTYGVGSTITVNVRANTENQAANTAEANISYSNATLTLTKVSQGATFYLPAPGSPSKSGSSAYFGGGLPNPGYTGSAGGVGTLTFVAKAEGEATITIDSGKVLLNDGFGTDALNGTTSAHFTITAAATPPPNSSSGTSKVVVNSSSHPDASKWYQATTVTLSWLRPDNAYGFSFELNQVENTIPDATLETTITTTKTYSDLAEGTYYFHIKARTQTGDFGDTTNFRINIDTTKPKAFDITLSGRTISYTTTDDLSGIDHYEIFVDGADYLNTTASSLELANLSGKHTVKVAAVDRAGNSAEASINVDLPAASFWTRTLAVPMLVILLFNLLLFILLLIIIYLLTRRNRKNNGVDIERVQDEIDSSLEDLKLQISKKLNSLSEASTEDLIAKETVVAKDIRNGIVNTKRQIDSRLRKARRKKLVTPPPPEIETPE